MDGQNTNSFSAYASRFLSSPAHHADRDSPLFHNDIPNPYLASPSSSSQASLPHLRGSPPDMDHHDEQDHDHDLPSASGLLFQDPASLHPQASIKGKERNVAPDPSRTNRGWLAHQSIFPPSSSSSASSSPPDSPRSSRRLATAAYELEDSDSEGSLISEKPSDPPSPPRHALPHLGMAPPPGEGLDDPLLADDDDQDGRTRERIPVRLEVYQARFGVWSDGQGIVLRKFKDSGFLALWLSSLMLILVGLVFVWGSTDPAPLPNPDSPTPPPTPFSTLLHTLPILFPLLLLSLAFPLAFLFLLKHTVRPVLTATAALVPAGLFICAWWAFVGSFGTIGDGTSQGRIEGTWWGTTGLRLFSLFLMLVAALFARMVWLRRKRLERTVAVVELSTTLLLTHPPMLLLTPILLGAFALISLPFLTLALRLLLVGYYRHPRENTWVWHVKPYAGWLVFAVTLIWVWTWGVVRGVGRVAVAAIVGEWYFHRDDPEHPAALEITQAAVHRATGTSLGSICLGALIVATVRIVGRTAAEARRITNPRSQILPSALGFLTRLTPLFTILAGVLDQLNGYALVYVGITGDAFWPSARRAVGLAGRRRAGKLLDYTLIKLLLTLSSTTLALCTATAGYLYATHTLGAPSHAPLAALLCGGVPFLCVRAGAGVLGDAADALFICYQIDREAGGDHSEKAKQAFSGDSPRPQDNV